MARLCLTEKEKKRRLLFKKYENKILIYKKFMIKKDIQYKYKLLSKLQKIPRNAYKVRQRNRCFLTGRSRGFFRRFGLSRHMIKLLSCNGEIPGLFKACW